MEDAGAETQPDLVTACKQPSESKIFQKCLIPQLHQSWQALTTQNINLGDLEGILKITFCAKYINSNVSLAKNTEYFIICRKGGDIKCEQEEIFNPRMIIQFSLGFSVYFGGRNPCKNINTKSELLQFTNSELEILRSMDHNLKMFDVQWQEHSPKKRYLEGQCWQNSLLLHSKFLSSPVS